MHEPKDTPLILPRWLDTIKPVVAVGLAVVPVYVITMLYLGGSPETINVGYQPVQPVEYSHALHAGELGIDCRYCHNTVERTAGASIPSTDTCMNCHAKIHGESEKLAPVRASYESGMSVRWIRVHDLADYVYFNHSAHVTRGVGCVECHGRVDRMEVVHQVESLSMGWCLDCHRNPETRLRPVDRVTDMEWAPEDGDRESLGARLRAELDIHPSEDCSTCHR